MQANPQSNGDTCQLSYKNITLALQSQSNIAETNCKRPKLSKARDKNDQLCKDVDRLDSRIRDQRTPCNVTVDE